MFINEVLVNILSNCWILRNPIQLTVHTLHIQSRNFS